MGKKDETKPAAKTEGPTGISRRDFIKFGVGAAAVTVSAAGLMGKLPLSIGQSKSQTTSPAAPRNNAEPIVATVRGDQVTVMNGQDSVKIKDPLLAGLIAGKLVAGN